MLWLSHTLSKLRVSRLAHEGVAETPRSYLFRKRPSGARLLPALGGRKEESAPVSFLSVDPMGPDSLTAALKAFDFASDLAKQLITLSTGILALTITFTKEFVKDFEVVRPRLLLVTWVSYLLAILMGIATLMSLTGSLANPTPSTPGIPEFLPGVFLFAGAQILAFLAGTISLISYAWSAMRSSTIAPTSTTPKSVEPTAKAPDSI